MSEVIVLNILRKPLLLPFFQSHVSAGFPSPAEDHRGVKLDLNALLLSHPQASYLVQVQGHSMTGGESGIRDGSLLAVDCHLTPRPNDIIIAVIEGLHTVKRLVKRPDGSMWLVPDNPMYPSIPLDGEPDLYDCWGVVTHVLTETRPGKLSRYVRVS